MCASSGIRGALRIGRRSRACRTRRCRRAVRRSPRRRPIIVSCSCERDAVPELDEHADDPRDLVRASGRPGGLAARPPEPRRVCPSRRRRRVLGFAVPSLKPMQVARRARGRGGLWKPSMRQRGCIAPRVCLVRSRRAWRTLSVLCAQIWMLRSPPHCGRVEVVVREASASRSGRRGEGAPSPKRSSKRLLPMPSTNATCRDGSSGPSTPLSSGGEAGPRFVGQAARRTAPHSRRVIVRSSSRSSILDSAITSNATNAVAGVGSLRIAA